MTKEEAENYKIDRSMFGPGPWDNEPDRVDFTTSAGYPGLILRNRLGNLCGYVGLPSKHRMYGHGYEDVDVNVHGGLTYAGSCEKHICHVADEAGDKTWWLGFDCAHGGDLMPWMLNNALEAIGKPRNPAFERPCGFLGMPETYRDISYVKEQCNDLAKQLKDLE